MGVGDGDPVDVGDRQGEAGALQQARGVLHVGEGRDAGARAAQDLALGGHQRLAQLGQRLRRPGRRR